MQGKRVDSKPIQDTKVTMNIYLFRIYFKKTNKITCNFVCLKLNTMFINKCLHKLTLNKHYRILILSKEGPRGYLLKIFIFFKKSVDKTRHKMLLCLS